MIRQIVAQKFEISKRFFKILQKISKYLQNFYKFYKILPNERKFARKIALEGKKFGVNIGAWQRKTRAKIILGEKVRTKIGASIGRKLPTRKKIFCKHLQIFVKDDKMFRSAGRIVKNNFVGAQNLETYRSGRTEPHSKCGCREIGTWVRIPPSPPNKKSALFGIRTGGKAKATVLRLPAPA